MNIQSVANEKNIAAVSTGVLFFRRETQNDAAAEWVQAVWLMTPHPLVSPSW